MASQSLSERQEDEIQALLSIFMDDASDLREQDAWKVLKLVYILQFSIPHCHNMSLHQPTL